MYTFVKGIIVYSGTYPLSAGSGSPGYSVITEPIALNLQRDQVGALTFGIPDSYGALTYTWYYGYTGGPWNQLIDAADFSGSSTNTLSVVGNINDASSVNYMCVVTTALSTISSVVVPLSTTDFGSWFTGSYVSPVTGTVSLNLTTSLNAVAYPQLNGFSVISVDWTKVYSNINLTTITDPAALNPSFNTTFSGPEFDFTIWKGSVSGDGVFVDYGLVQTYSYSSTVDSNDLLDTSNEYLGGALFSLSTDPVTISVATSAGQTWTVTWTQVSAADYGPFNTTNVNISAIYSSSSSGGMETVVTHFEISKALTVGDYYETFFIFKIDDGNGTVKYSYIRPYWNASA